MEPKTSHRLRDIVDYARRNSPYYSKAYAHLPHDVALEDLPVVDQEAFWEANRHPSQVITSALSEAMVFKSGGTTGSPKFSYYTRDEWAEFAGGLGRGVLEAGLRSGHRVANLFYVGELYAGFVVVLDMLRYAPVDLVNLPIGGGAPLDSTITTLSEFRVDVVMGAPTTLCRLAEQLLQQDRQLADVELLLFAGEALYDDQRRLLAAAFPNAQARSLGYGSVDAGLLGCPVAGADTRVHRACHPQTIMEVLDEETDTPIHEAGRPGRLVVTSLTRKLMPVIRYPVGDRAEWADEQAGTFRLLGRAEEGARIGMVTLYVQDVLDVVQEADTEGLVTGVQLVVRRWNGRDGLVLRLAGTQDEQAAAEPLNKLGALIVAKLNAARPMYPEAVRASKIHPLSAEWVRHTALEINSRSGKLKRVVDERPVD